MRERRGFAVDFRIIRPDGSIRFVHSKGQPVLDDAGATVEVMGVIMDVTDRKRAERALRRARERTLEARFAAMLAERTRLAREIHDTLLQGFTGVGLKLVAVANRVTGQPETAAELREVVALAQKTLEDARRAVWDMRSPSLAAGEFTAALRTAVEESTQGTGALAGLRHGRCNPGRWIRRSRPSCSGWSQEAIANVVKHAAAQSVRVRCVFGARQLRVTIADDGKGFAVDPDFRAYGGHWGLLGMRERAGQIGAKVAVRSSPGQGARVTLLVPYRARGGPDPRQA